MQLAGLVLLLMMLNLILLTITEIDIDNPLRRALDDLTVPKLIFSPAKEALTVLPSNGNVTTNLIVTASDISTYINPHANLLSLPSTSTSTYMPCALPSSSLYDEHHKEPSETSSDLDEDEIRQALASLPAFFQKCFDLEAELSEFKSKVGNLFQISSNKFSETHTMAVHWNIA